LGEAAASEPDWLDSWKEIAACRLGCEGRRRPARLL